MPFYHALVNAGLLGPAERQAFANDVVDVHCGVTGAPRSFVHVLFTDADPQRMQLGQVCKISGTIRHGRTDEQKARIVGGIRDAFVRRTGADPSTITVATTDIPASFTMEAGELLPEPGSVEEEAWKAAG